MFRIFSTIVLVLLLLLSPPTILAMVSQDATPNNRIKYPIKRKMEDVILYFAKLNPTTQAMFEIDRSERRFNESKKLFETGDVSAKHLKELLQQTNQAARDIKTVKDPNEKKRLSTRYKKLVDEYQSTLKKEADNVRSKKSTKTKSKSKTVNPTPQPVDDQPQVQPTEEPELTATPSPSPTTQATPEPTSSGNNNPPVVTLKINGSNQAVTVDNNSTVKLEWTATNAPTNCLASNGINNWSGQKAVPSGSMNMGPLTGPATLSFVIKCSNSKGFGNIATVSVVVKKPANDDPCADLAPANPNDPPSADYIDCIRDHLNLDPLSVNGVVTYGQIQDTGVTAEQFPGPDVSPQPGRSAAPSTAPTTAPLTIKSLHDSLATVSIEPIKIILSTSSNPPNLATDCNNQKAKIIYYSTSVNKVLDNSLITLDSGFSSFKSYYNQSMSPIISRADKTSFTSSFNTVQTKQTAAKNFINSFKTLTAKFDCNSNPTQSMSDLSTNITSLISGFNSYRDSILTTLNSAIQLGF